MSRDPGYCVHKVDSGVATRPTASNRGSAGKLMNHSECRSRVNIALVRPQFLLYIINTYCVQLTNPCIRYNLSNKT